MEKEIELKIMLEEKNISTIKAWINTQNILSHEKEILGNTYYDSLDGYFQRNQMGLRVRNKNQQFELTLKTKGEITGGLHIRPEYNLPLENSTPDLKKLVSHFNLNIENVEQLQSHLQAIFSTDFTREKWLVDFQKSKIEIALDRGVIKNPFGEDVICELEFELKEGNLVDLLAFLDELPKEDGMWFSSLSKAQRGYLVGQPHKIAKEIDKLTACNIAHYSNFEKYQFGQQLADFIRLEPNNDKIISQYRNIHEVDLPENILNYLSSKHYLLWNLTKIRMFC
ncbi:MULTISPECIES: inorganic triphosphatase [Glaesserella]|uniref:CYTH domain-containing protein n=1 Tax=Glaesserella australis TaxID=2094024 RepID=A0A328BVU0_9PAST|nr:MULTISPECIES: CYTH domain-containing protein [Glaesserella]AUI66071.1 adenylate cyclase [Glaesserella sp. 15-184]RAL18209.1 CYTH domain-containing protein [Glaesserella australis]